MSITEASPVTATPVAAPPSVVIGAARRPHLLRTGLVAGVVASVATTLAAVVARWAGADLAVAGERIPLNGFATLTMVGALIGVVLAAAFSRWADRPRAMFVRTTVVLTALSIVPDVIADATIATRAVLALTHVIAAVIIVPALASRLDD
jgi:hypothetical protein